MMGLLSHKWRNTQNAHPCRIHSYPVFLLYFDYAIIKVCNTQCIYAIIKRPLVLNESNITMFPVFGGR